MAAHRLSEDPGRRRAGNQVVPRGCDQSRRLLSVQQASQRECRRDGIARRNTENSGADASLGYRRITAALQRAGREVNHKRVLRLMRADNLLCLRKRAFVHTTDSDHELPVYPRTATRPSKNPYFREDPAAGRGILYICRRCKARIAVI